MVPEPDARTAISILGPPRTPGHAQCRHSPGGVDRLANPYTIGDMASHQEVPAADWETWANDNSAVVLDVRNPNEWGLGTLPNATLIPMHELPGRLSELEQTQAILCVCRSGARSGQVAKFLVHNGYSNVANMSGGMKALGMQD